MDILYFTPDEYQELKEKDERLGKVMDITTLRIREITPDLFSTMIRQMIHQQISMKSAETVWGRFQEKLESITPKTILSLSIDELQGLGISMKKALWIHEAAKKFDEDPHFYTELSTKSNEDIRNHLLTFSGIGPWTVDMLLMFSLGRKDILSYEDLGVKNGLMKLYGLDSISKKEFQSYREKFSPLGTLASLYFWEVYSKDFPLEKLPPLE